LELRTDRDGLLEGNDLYTEFYKKLIDYLGAKFEKKSESTENEKISKKQKRRLERCLDYILVLLYTQSAMTRTRDQESTRSRDTYWDMKSRGGLPDLSYY